MKTLIELYDERTIENYIGPETFHPEKIVYLCPPEVAQEHHFEITANQFLKHRGIDATIEIVESSLYKADHIVSQLRKIVEENEECVLDITGGTDAGLFATGVICKEKNLPAFTYSRRQNRFYNIYNAEFAEKYPCEIEYSVSDFFEMTGGTLRKGRVDAESLSMYQNKFEGFFSLYLEHKRDWTDFITFMTRISQPHNEEAFRLEVSGGFVQKGERGSRVLANIPLLKGVEKLGFIFDLKIEKEETVSFRFADEQVRFWLRDVGSVLELYIYKKCMDAKIFSDVVSSAIVDWDGTNTRGSVSNEIDVVGARGVIPLFISCKACDIKTEAINELAILKERFGGKGAKAAIVTTEQVTASARHRAAQLGIAIIDVEELEENNIVDRLMVIMKLKEHI